jgi:tRNA/tmRNA/rRNA uracil-C5-methylase (TrmA/RlmC/RlmD family)
MNLSDRKQHTVEVMITLAIYIRSQGRNTKSEDKYTGGCGHCVWKSFRQAFKSMWKKKEIKAMLQRLSLQREQLVVAITR